MDGCGDCDSGDEVSRLMPLNPKSLTCRVVRAPAAHAVLEQSARGGYKVESHVTPHTSHLTRHTSHLTRHTSHLTPHTSHLTLCSTLTKVTTSTPPFSLLKCSGCRSNHTVSLNLWWRRFMHARPLVRPLETKPQTPYQISSNHRRSITRRSWAKGKQGPIFERMSVIFLNQSPVILLCRSSTTKLPNRASLWQTYLASHGIRWDIRA